MTNRTYIIAEAGVNHNGDVNWAMELVDAAVEAQANAVKFQTFRAEKLAAKSVPKADYQVHSSAPAESQLQMLKRLELSPEAHLMLKEYCQGKGIDFMSTPFDEESLDFLIKGMGLRQIKISSGDLTNAPLLLKAAQSGKPIILSTGMSTLAEIEAALAVLAYGYTRSNQSLAPSLKQFEQALFSVEGRAALINKVELLHCTTEYPAPFDEVNLRAMTTMQRAFGLPVGLSDHTPGIAIPVAAVALGATIIEKHFTLDKTLPGPDHRASLEPSELKQMVLAIRQTEQALGSQLKAPTPSELKNKAVARKCLVASRSIRTGEVFTTENLTVKRAGDGISPFRYWEALGQKATQDYQADEKVVL
ncbi:MAG: N-acetylneuraminate synthase [Desulfitobacteriaceae bacterium]|nr:N-acetylneuraminate synthase [Desulfitobacteriaceae bacterium]MDI6912953.1 N-acetylneuraminate synthase [Desulfitobacteriaceae bacterium]